MNSITIVMIMQMMRDDYVPVKRKINPTIRTKEEVKKSFKDMGRFYNVKKVNKNLRRQHNIKQPGFDVQRKSVMR